MLPELGIGAKYFVTLVTSLGLHVYYSDMVFHALLREVEVTTDFTGCAQDGVRVLEVLSKITGIAGDGICAYRAGKFLAPWNLGQGVAGLTNPTQALVVVELVLSCKGIESTIAARVAGHTTVTLVHMGLMIVPLGECHGAEGALRILVKWPLLVEMLFQGM